MILFLALLLLCSFLSCDRVDQWPHPVSRYNYPQALRVSAHTEEEARAAWLWGPVCMLASSTPRSFNAWPEFHQLDQYDNKMSVRLGHPRKSALQTPREAMLQALEPSLQQSLICWPCSSEFAMIHSQHVPLVLSEMFEMIFFFVAFQGFECRYEPHM